MLCVHLQSDYFIVDNLLEERLTVKVQHCYQEKHGHKGIGCICCSQSFQWQEYNVA